MPINLVLNAIVNNLEMLGVLIACYVMLFAVVAVTFLTSKQCKSSKKYPFLFFFLSYLLSRTTKSDVYPLSHLR